MVPLEFKLVVLELKLLFSLYFEMMHSFYFLHIILELGYANSKQDVNLDGCFLPFQVLLDKT